MFKIFYLNDFGDIIHNVKIIDEDKNIQLLNKVDDSNLWELENIKEKIKYQLIINDEFIIPDLNNDFIVEDNILYSLANTPKKFTYPTIDSITLSKQLYLRENKIIPIEKSNIFNSLDESVNILCHFSNVKRDFLLLLEIYTEKKLIGIIPAMIEKGLPKDKYHRTYFCSLDTTNFIGLNDTVTVRLKLSNKIFEKITFRFNTLQNYKPPKQYFTQFLNNKLHL